METSTLLAYKYEGLPKGDAFRYLVLQPGTDQDPLECVLNQPVVCDGKTLFVTPNLSQVLRRLRLRDAPRTLWADSICINQGDLKEKGHQVAIMSMIYRKATQVLIYMGEDLEGHGPHVQSLLEEVWSMFDAELKKIPLTWDSFPYYKNVPFVDDARWASVFALLKQEWFVRGWVVREAALARTGRVIWDQGEFDWEKLMVTFTWLVTRAQVIISGAGDILDPADIHMDAYVNRYYAYTNRHFEGAQCLLNESAWQNISILDFLATGRRLQMSNPRDRLYAFLDMSTAKERKIEVDPNYGEPPSLVFQKFAASYIRATESLNILEYVVHDAQSLQSCVSTWAPDWDYRESQPSEPYGHAALTSRAGSVTKPMLIKESVLKVRGVILEPVRFAISVFDRSTTTMKTLASIWSTVQSWSNKSPYQNSDSLLAFSATLTEGRYDGEWSTWLQDEAEYIKGLKAACSSCSEATCDESEISKKLVHTLTKERVHCKRFILTERGYMDMCGIIFGCTVPCILRKTSRQGYYKFFGNCFVLGSQTYETETGYVVHDGVLGSDFSKDWLDWDVEEQDIYLC
ncbi:hypothetical protein EJ07DRAFT_164021 [Lizonia empirigonia]|nr:hypothetical protein EJ07DRAFT_164021 [Lizonia empirigonia]